jgi:Zn-dependent protease with chaperone function
MTPSTPPPLRSTTLSKDGIVLQKEKTYFTILITVSVIGWIVLTITVLGLVYALIGALVAWFLSGLLAARLKSESVEVTKEQLPDLYKTFEEVCEKLELFERPRFYILQHNGVLNAFASRHSGRNFIVVFSGLLEALGHDSERMKFLIGHEVGHIRRNHILKRIFLLPSMIIPMLGHAYHRACEATCDRFGLFAAGNTEAATQGLVVLAAGKQVSTMANPAAFARQYYDNRGFFISWHELSSGYPTLSQRVAKMLGIDIPFFSRNAPRNPLAYLFSFIFSIQMLVVAYLAFFFGLAYLNASKAKQTTRPARVSAVKKYPADLGSDQLPKGIETLSRSSNPISTSTQEVPNYFTPLDPSQYGKVPTFLQDPANPEAQSPASHQPTHVQEKPVQDDGLVTVDPSVINDYKPISPYEEPKSQH